MVSNTLDESMGWCRSAFERLLTDNILSWDEFIYFASELEVIHYFVTRVVTVL